MNLKCPFPYFGGKSRVAQLVWERLAGVDNYIEPFAGSLALLLARPSEPKTETVNDVNCYVANFWRATRHAPELVAEHADWPVNEADLHARHRWLVLSAEAAEFRERMRRDPAHFDPKIAGWWCWGACCWIGGGWCDSTQLERHQNALPLLSGAGGRGLTSSGSPPERRPQIGGDNPGSVGKGVHAGGGLSQQLPLLSSACGDAAGAGEQGELPQGRPQLGDAYDIGRGVHASPKPSCLVARRRPPGSVEEGTCLRHKQPHADMDRGINHEPGGTCAQRRAWLCDWFGRLRDRLRNVRVCCGHWLRVCDSHSVTTRLGSTGLFLDPPYPTHAADGSASRAGNLYATDAGKDALDALRDEVLAYCLERGADPQMRIAVCGYDSDGYAALEAHGWEVLAWRAQGGYGNRSAQGKANAGRERIWFSPACQAPRQRSLFDADPQSPAPVPAPDPED